jgi:hypothetical protein
MRVRTLVFYLLACLIAFVVLYVGLYGVSKKGAPPNPLPSPQSVVPYLSEIISEVETQ